MNWRILVLFSLGFFIIQPTNLLLGQQKKAGSLTRRIQKLEVENLQIRAEINLLKERLDALLGSDPQARLFDLPINDSPIRGNPEAPLTLMEFGDYQSDYTARAQHVVKRLLEEYQESLRFVFKHYPITALHPQANEAALAALSGEKQDKTWEIHDLLLQNTRRLEPNLFLVLAQQLGMDLTKFDQDRRSLWALERLSADEKLAVQSEVAGVPVFFLNGRRLSNWRYDYVKTQMEKQLKLLAGKK